MAPQSSTQVENSRLVPITRQDIFISPNTIDYRVLVKLIIAALFTNASEDNGLNKFQQKQQPSVAGSKYNQVDDSGLLTTLNTTANYGDGPRPLIRGLTDAQEQYYFLRAQHAKDARDLANTQARAVHDASKIRQQAQDQQRFENIGSKRKLMTLPIVTHPDEGGDVIVAQDGMFDVEPYVDTAIDQVPYGKLARKGVKYLYNKVKEGYGTGSTEPDFSGRGFNAKKMPGYTKTIETKVPPKERQLKYKDAFKNVKNDWHPSSESMNKLQHALVGNMVGKMKTKTKAKAVARPKMSARPAKAPAPKIAPRAVRSMVRRDVKGAIKTGGIMGGITKFKHTDFLGTIVEGNSLTVPLTTSFLLNAGESTFPFGRRIARNFQRYRITKCTVRFVPIAYPGVNAVTAGDINSQGSLTLLFNCCPTDDPPTSLVELMNYPAHWRKTALCTNPLSLVLPVDESGVLQNGTEWFYTRPYAVQVDEDARLTDYGRLHICRIAGNSGNISGASNLGYIYLDYEFELAQPMLSGSIGTDQGSSGYRFLSLVTGSAYFVSPAALASNPFPISFPTTSSFIIPEAGRYIVTYFTQAVTSVSASVGLSAGTNCTAVNMFPLTGTTQTSTFVAASANTETLSICVDVVSNGTQTGGTITTTGVLTIVGACSGFLFVTCVPTSFQFGSSNSSKVLENLTNKLRDITQRVKLMQIASDEKEFDTEKSTEVLEEEKEYLPVTLTASNTPPAKIQPIVPATATRKGYF